MATERTRRFRSHSVQFPDLGARERRTVFAGIAVSVLALLVAFVALPLERRWSQREALIDSSAERLSRLRSLVASESALRSTLATRERGTAGARNVVSGRTPALAAAELQSAVQSYALRSRVSVNRLDVAGAPDTAGTILPMIPASLQAVGDIHGVSEFLSFLEAGTPVMEIREMTIVSNSSLRGGLLQLSLALRVPSVIE